MLRLLDELLLLRLLDAGVLLRLLDELLLLRLLDDEEVLVRDEFSLRLPLCCASTVPTHPSASRAAIANVNILLLMVSGIRK